MGIDPFTLAAASLVTGALGTVSSVVGGIQNANAQASQMQYQAAIADRNAQIANRNAAYAAQAGEAKAQQEGLKNREILGRVRVAEAANGLDINSGSDLDVREAQRITGVEDVDQLRHNAMLQAYGYQTQSGNFTAQAAADRAGASNVTALEPLTAATSALAGLSSLGTKWTGFNQAGVFDQAPGASPISVSVNDLNPDGVGMFGLKGPV